MGWSLPSPLAVPLLLVFDEPADLDGVVGEDPEPAPGLGSVETVDEGPGPSEVPFEVVDPSFCAGAPFDETHEGAATLDVLAGDAGTSFAGDRHPVDTQVLEVGFDSGFAVAPVGGHRPRGLPEPGGDPSDGRGQQRGVWGLPIITS